MRSLLLYVKFVIGDSADAFECFKGAVEKTSMSRLYLLLTEFEVRAVRYGPSLFPFDLWPKRDHEERGP